MRLAAKQAITVVLWITGACGTGVRRGPPLSSPAEPLPAPPAAPIRETTGPWAFAYANGSVSYRVVHTTTVEGQSDPAGRRQTSTERHRETISLAVRSPREIGIEAVLDSLELSPALSSPDSLSLPVRIFAELTGDQLRFRDNGARNRCTSGESIVAIDVQLLIVRFPDPLVKGATWSRADSTGLCQNGITTSSVASHTYAVIGETAGKFTGLVQVQRTSTINGSGEGVLGQHRIRLTAVGSETSNYYVEPSTGRITVLQTDQKLNIRLENSGRVHQFTQHSRRDYEVVR